MRAGGRAIRLAEYAVPTLATLALLAASAIVSAKKYFWNDELYSYYLLSDPSFTHMLAAFHHPINNTPPLYFLLGWLWARPFGAGELSLRIFSSIGMCAALWLVWLTLRRAQGFWPASLGTLAVFGTAGIIFEQNAEARMYGLYLMLAAAAMLLYDRSMREPEISRRTAVAVFAVHAALVLTHLHGPIYSAAFLLAIVLADAARGTFRLRACLPIVAGWMTFALYLPSFLSQSEAGRPRSWLPVPTLNDLLEFMTLANGELLLPTAVILIVLLAGLYPLLGGASPAESRAPPSPPANLPHSDAHLPVLAFVLIGVPVLVWLVSRTVRPIFYDRYLIPSTLGWAILLGHVTRGAMARTPASGPPRASASAKLAAAARAAAPALILLLFLAQPLFAARAFPARPRPGSDDDRFGHTDLPIVLSQSFRFLERQRYADRPERYVFILDRDAALVDASGAFGPQEHAHLVAIRHHYGHTFDGRIVESDEFLATHDRFLVLDNPDFARACPPRVSGVEAYSDMHCPQWVEMRLLADPAWSVRVLGTTREGVLLLVESDPADTGQAADVR